MRFPFLKQTAVGIGAALVVLLVFTAVWFSLQSGPADPAKLVPAKETIAFFTQLTKQNAPLFSASVPLLSQVPLSDTPSAVALLKTGSGQTGWAVLQPTENLDQPFNIQTSNASFDPLFQNVEEPLSRLYAYRAITKNGTSKGTAWLRFPDIGLNRTSPLNSFLNVAQPVAITLADDGLEVSMLSDDSFPVLMNGPKEMFTDPLFILHVSNGSALMSMLSDALKPDARLVSKTVLTTALTSLFGKNLSAAYDLPPLLSGPTTLEVAKNEAGSLRVYLEGTIPGDETALTHLVDLFKANLTTGTRFTQTFDEKFDWQDIREDKNRIEDISDAKNGWTTQTIRQPENGNALFVATRGRHYILSNDADVFAKAVEQEAAVLGANEAPPSGLGLMQSKNVSTLLRQTAPTLWPATLQIPAGPSEFLKWKLTQEGRRVTIVFKKI